MTNLVRVEPIALMPTPAGCAIFLGDGQKVIVFYIDLAIGASINAVLADQKSPRPLSHDLFVDALIGFGAQVTRVVIVRKDGDIFYARLFLEAQNEIMERKIVELDARPSDCIALAVRTESPMYVVRDVWDQLEDMSQQLEEMRHQNPPDDDSPGIG